jgi:hypothetical protein
MNTKPVFSILMPLFNHAHLVRRAVDSVLSQSFSSWELLICNDGSTDDSLDVVRRYADPRIKIVDKYINSGVADALNTALFMSSGEYICWLSSDDYFSATKLAEHWVWHRLDDDTPVTVAPCALVVDGKTSLFRQLRPEPVSRLIYFIYGNYLNGLSICAHRRVYERCGLFNSRYIYAQDENRWINILRHYRPVYMDGEPLSFSQIGTSSSSNVEYGMAFDSMRVLYDQLRRFGLAAFAADPDRDVLLGVKPIAAQFCALAIRHLLDPSSKLAVWGLESVARFFVESHFRRWPTEVPSVCLEFDRICVDEELRGKVLALAEVAEVKSTGRAPSFFDFLASLRSADLSPSLRSFIDYYVSKTIG